MSTPENRGGKGPSSRPLRLPLLGLGAVALFAGLYGGLLRMGALPSGAARAAADHGPLMISGFLGTVISLERAVASGRRWAYLAPLLCGAGALLGLGGLHGPAELLPLAGSALVLAVLVGVLRMDPALHHAVLATAAAAWVAGNALLLAGRPVFDVVPFWSVFLIGTICGERLELTRLLPRTRLARDLFVVAAAALACGAALTLWDRALGMRLWGLGAVGLFFWLVRYDVARRTIRQSGAVRFIAAALLAGYFWLGVGGGLAIGFGHPVAGPHYDALLHAIFVGFVFSMIFGHAMVIVPAVLGVRVEFRQRFYLHLGLLHGSLAARVMGDLMGSSALRLAGAWVSAGAILVFILSTAAATRRRQSAGVHPR